MCYKVSKHFLRFRGFRSPDVMFDFLLEQSYTDRRTQHVDGIGLIRNIENRKSIFFITLNLFKI